MDTVGPTSRSSRIPSSLIRDIAARMNFDPGVAPDLDGLSAVYAAWCRSIPFDNIQKMIALGSGAERLPGLDAVEFFEMWLRDGTGGTCWPTSNALWALLCGLGFDAIRVAGSMYDTGTVNHGTVKVRIGEMEWLVDTSMFTEAPLPLGREVHIAAKAEVEPAGGSHVVWADFVPSPVFIPCRLLRDLVDDALYADRYEIFSREQSPFNGRLYFRTAGQGGASLILGNTKFSRVDGGVEALEFSPDGLREHLEASGISAAAIKEWESCGGMAMSFDPSNAHVFPEVNGLRPSLRPTASAG